MKVASLSLILATLLPQTVHAWSESDCTDAFIAALDADQNAVYDTSIADGVEVAGIAYDSESKCPTGFTGTDCDDRARLCQSLYLPHFATYNTQAAGHLMTAEATARLVIQTIQNDAKPHLSRLSKGASPTFPLDSNYEYRSSGSGVKVWVVGTGGRKTHSEFGSPTRMVHKYSAFKDRDDPNNAADADDCHAAANGTPAGAGTAGAAVAGGESRGVAKGIEIFVVRGIGNPIIINESVVGCDQLADFTKLDAALTYIKEQIRDNYADQRNVVLHMWWTGTQANFQRTQDLITELDDLGALNVAAAGNQPGTGVDACLVAPAKFKSVLTVGGTNNDNDGRHTTSNFGKCVKLFAQSKAIDSAGRASDSHFTSFGGTSFAAAAVTGAAALLWGENPTWTAKMVFDALVVGATKDAVGPAEDTSGTTRSMVYTLTEVGPTLAEFDSAENSKAPRCAYGAWSCHTGTLVEGRDTSESNGSNTLADACEDSTATGDTANQRIRVSTLDGTPLSGAKRVRLEAVVTGESVDPHKNKLAVFVASSATNPTWELVSTLERAATRDAECDTTLVSCPALARAGRMVWETEFDLPDGTTPQVLRVQFLYDYASTLTDGDSCLANYLADRDDLIFGVSDAESRSVTWSAPAAGNVAGAVTLTAAVSPSSGVTKVEFFAKQGAHEVFLGKATSSPYSVTWNTLESALNGSYTLVARAIDTDERVSVSADREVTVANTVATYSSTWGGPDCSGTSMISCETGNLLKGRGNMTGGNEPNQPNNGPDDCGEDKHGGVYKEALSVEVIKLWNKDLVNPLSVGARAVAEIEIYADKKLFGSDQFDLYYRKNADAMSSEDEEDNDNDGDGSGGNGPTGNGSGWIHIGTYFSGDPGLQRFRMEFDILDGGVAEQALKVQGRHGKTHRKRKPRACNNAGRDVDHDTARFRVTGYSE